MDANARFKIGPVSICLALVLISASLLAPVGCQSQRRSQRAAGPGDNLQAVADVPGSQSAFEQAKGEFRLAATVRDRDAALERMVAIAQTTDQEFDAFLCAGDNRNLEQERVVLPQILKQLTLPRLIRVALRNVPPEFEDALIAETVKRAKETNALNQLEYVAHVNREGAPIMVKMRDAIERAKRTGNP